MLRAIYDPKLNEGTLAGQAAEFMSIMSHKVRGCSVDTAAAAGLAFLKRAEQCCTVVLAKVGCCRSRI